MNTHSIKVEIAGDVSALRRQLARYGHFNAKSIPLDGWLAPRRSRVVLVERSRGFLHLWVGPFGLHLARPLHRSRLDFCADWWR